MLPFVDWALPFSPIVFVVRFFIVVVPLSAMIICLCAASRDLRYLLSMRDSYCLKSWIALSLQRFFFCRFVRLFDVCFCLHIHCSVCAPKKHVEKSAKDIGKKKPPIITKCNTVHIHSFLCWLFRWARAFGFFFALCLMHFGKAAAVRGDRIYMKMKTLKLKSIKQCQAIA